MDSYWDNYYSSPNSLIPWKNKNLQILNQFINHFHLSGQLHVLDIGCGLGEKSLLLANRGFIVTAVDISIKAITLAQQENSHENITYINGDIESLKNIPQLKGHFYDVVIDLFASQFVSDQFEYIRQLLAFLKKPSHIIHASFLKLPGEIHENREFRRIAKTKIAVETLYSQFELSYFREKSTSEKQAGFYFFQNK